MFWMRRPKTAVISFDNEWAYFLVSRNWKTTLNVEPEYETKLSQHQYIFKLFQVMEWIRRVSFWMTWSSPISIRILEIFFSLFLSYRSLKKNHRTRSSVKIPTMIINDVIMHFKIAISPIKISIFLALLLFGVCNVLLPTEHYTWTNEFLLRNVQVYPALSHAPIHFHLICSNLESEGGAFFPP